MASLARQYGHESPSHEMLRDAVSRLHATTTAQVFEFGLHETITAIIININAIAETVAADYRFTA